MAVPTVKEDEEDDDEGNTVDVDCAFAMCGTPKMGVASSGSVARAVMTPSDDANVVVAAVALVFPNILAVSP
jgi:hypothetical protein